jgi:uncharacterized protein (DUF2235 family)
MSKRVVICCDGTGNSFENVAEESNVIKLYSSLKVNADQVCYYHPGVGTMGAPNARGRIEKEWTKIKGLAFGSGLLPIVGDAYRFLMDNYADGDEIYLFGFSRGAYTVRVLASLIHVYGMLCAGNHELIPYILSMYAKNSKDADHKHRTFQSDEAFKWQFSHAFPVTIKFCGIWDTVSSYGWAYDPIDLPFLGSNPILEIGRHAVSIDERRCFYQDNLWGEPTEGQDFRQVWFRGVHSDVGGSYEEPTSGLAKIALEWMLVQLTDPNLRLGIQIDRNKAQIVLGNGLPSPQVPGLPQFYPPDPNEPPHKSLHGAWWILEFMPHVDPHLNGKGLYIPRGRRRTISEKSFVHESALNFGVRPVNVPKDVQPEPWKRF